jgi:hypothetical protein
VSALESKLESTRLVEPVANVIVEILLRIVVRSAGTGVTRRKRVKQAPDERSKGIGAFLRNRSGGKHQDAITAALT